MGLRAEKTPNTERSVTNLRQRGRSTRTPHTMMIGVEEQRRRRRKPSRKNERRKRAPLGAMTLRGTVNRKRARSQSQKKRSGSPRSRLALPPWKAQNLIWRLRVRKVRGKRAEFRSSSRLKSIIGPNLSIWFKHLVIILTSPAVSS